MGVGARGDVRLSGELVCANGDEAARVERLLPEHIVLTRAEDGCLSFEVARIDGALVWRVEEQFRDAAAFRLHQRRAAESTWGIETAGIERHYTIEGL